MGLVALARLAPCPPSSLSGLESAMNHHRPTNGVRELGGLSPGSAQRDPTVGSRQGGWALRCPSVRLASFLAPPSHRSWSGPFRDTWTTRRRNSSEDLLEGLVLSRGITVSGLACDGQAAGLLRGPIGGPMRFCHWFRVTSAACLEVARRRTAMEKSAGQRFR
jgi:hypothetical protein